MQITNHHHTHHHHQHFNVQGNGNAGPEVAQLKEIIMALTAEVQRALDLARQNRTLSGSVDEGVKALRIQVADLQEKLDAVPVAPAKAMSQEDKDALVEIGDDLDNSISTLKADIPANIPDPAPAAPPAPPVAQTTPAVDPAQQQADAAAASAAKPIAGTGVSDGNPAPTASAAGQPVTPAGQTLPDPANPSTTNVVTPPTDGSGTPRQPTT